MNAVKRVSTLIFCAAAWLPVTGQVSNNNIQGRSELTLNEPVHSSTHNNTVEWNCINKELTQKCLVYHNDQWFHFTPERNGKLYLNIASQACRDLRGVQMIVIEGNPCEIQTYRIIKCIPKIFQDDVFLELDSLKAETLYLVNIDGYLGDFCRFEIELSKTPKGFPIANHTHKMVNLTGTDQDRAIVLNWSVTREQLDSIGLFEIYRRKKNAVKSQWLGKVGPYSNALGVRDENYAYADTLNEAGEYRYSIIGVTTVSQSRILLDEITVMFSPQLDFTVHIPLSFKKQGKVFISVVDPEKNYQTLNVIEHDYEAPATVPVDLSSYAQRGLRKFWIRVRNQRTGEVKLFGYYMDAMNRLHPMDQ